MNTRRLLPAGVLVLRKINCEVANHLAYAGFVLVNLAVLALLS